MAGKAETKAAEEAKAKKDEKVKIAKEAEEAKGEKTKTETKAAKAEEAKEVVKEGKAAPRQTKTSIIQSVIGDMYKMNKSQLEDIATSFNATKQPVAEEDKAKLAEPKGDDYKEDLQELFGADMDAQFIDDASAIFASAVGARVVTERLRMDEEAAANLELVNNRMAIRESRLEQRYSKALKEAVEEYKVAAESRIDRYLSHIAEDWTNNNKPVVETALKVQMAESLIGGLVRLIEDHDMKVEEGRFERLERRFGRKDEAVKRLKEELNNAQKTIIEQTEQLRESKRKETVNELSEGLTLAERERLQTLSEGLTTNDEESFGRQIRNVRDTLSERNRARGATQTSRILNEGSKTPISSKDTKKVKPEMTELQKATLAASRKFQSN